MTRIKRMTSTLLIACILLSALQARAANDTAEVRLALSYSGKEHYADPDACVEAMPLALGEAAPCSGQLIPETWAQEYDKLLDLAPKYKSNWKSCEKQLGTCMKQLKPECLPPVTPWYESGVFWGIAGVVAGILIGVGTEEYIRWQMRK